MIIFGAAVRPDGQPSGGDAAACGSGALATGRRLDDPLYMPTGGQGRYGRAEAEVMADVLAEGDVSRDSIILEADGGEHASLCAGVCKAAWARPTAGLCGDVGLPHAALRGFVAAGRGAGAAGLHAERSCEPAVEQALVLAAA